MSTPFLTLNIGIFTIKYRKICILAIVYLVKRSLKVN